jgi:hypothetical protein
LYGGAVVLAFVVPDEQCRIEPKNERSYLAEDIAEDHRILNLYNNIKDTWKIPRT